MKRLLIRILILSLVHFIPIWAEAQVSVSPPLPRLNVTSPFGQRIHPVTGRPDYHSGVDFAARSDPVLSVLDGMVKETGNHPNLGKYIRTLHGEVELIYGHLSRLLVSTGDTVTVAQPIGITGATGRVTGEHLHFSVKFNGRFLDPLKFLYRLIEQSNKHLNIE